jgi:Anti-sigma-K factor rskA, C-terminal
VAVVGMGGFALTQGIRANRFATQNRQLTDAFDFARANNASMTPVGPVTEMAASGVREAYVYGTRVPMPASGHTYALWVVQGTQATFLGDFLPDDGVVVVHVTGLDPTTYDGLLVTEERVGSNPAAPGPVKWASTTTAVSVAS